MVNAKGEITVVLSEAFVVLSNSTKVLLWLWLAFVFCSPFRIETIEKVNTGTSTLRMCSWGKRYNNAFPCIIKKFKSRAYGRFSWIQHCFKVQFTIYVTLFPQKYNFIYSCSCYFECQFSLVLFSVKPENVQLLTNITANNTCPGGYWFICSVCAANPQVISYQLLENDIAVDTSSSGMWMRTLSNSGEFTYKCLANNTVGSTTSANAKEIAITGNNFTLIFSPQNVTVCSI